MKIIVTVKHPAHVHLFKNIIWELEANNHDITIFVRDKEITTDLLDAYNIPYTTLTGRPDTLIGLLKMQALFEWRLLLAARRIKPDVMLSVGGTAISHVSKIVGAKSIVFSDDDPMNLRKRITYPFSDYICTPEGYRTDLGNKQIRYLGYHELAYLHPNRFQPDPEVLSMIGIDPKSVFYIVRFSKWDAYHDVNKEGLSPDMKKKIISYLSDNGSVFITSEEPLPAEFDEFRIPVEPHQIHHILFFSNLYVGDSQTMATEASILGTPAVRFSQWAADTDMSNFIELEEKYELLFSTADHHEAFDRIKQLTESDDLESKWNRKRERLLEDKIDVTAFVCNLVEEIGEQ